jgi:WhiB family redox-sensing transcriptional regulator
VEDQPEEDPTPDQAPTLTELEEARAGAKLARQIDLEWLMAHDDPPDVGVLLEQLVNRPEWHRSAACRGADPELFFPVRGVKPVEALAYCEGCSVRPQCLASAFEVAWDDGSVGWGTTGAARKGLRRSVA